MTNINGKYNLNMVVSLLGWVHTGGMTFTNRHEIGQMRALREAVGPGFSFVGPSEQILRTITGSHPAAGAANRATGRH